MRIIFRSEERYRGPLYAPPSTSPSSVPVSTQESQPAAVTSDRPFAIRETVDLDQTVRLALLGDLDLATAEGLTTRLAELKSAGRPVRLDLSQLAFVDSAGIQALLLALTDARWTGWPLEVAPQVSPTVERAAQILGIARVFWPTDPDTESAPSTAAARRHEPA
jgi:anti-anti-sigma factor